MINSGHGDKYVPPSSQNRAGAIYAHGSSSLSFTEYKRQVIQGAINRGVSFSSITKFGSIFEALGKNVRPNMSFDEMIDIQKNYRAAVGSIDQLQMTGQGTKINGIYYQILSEFESHSSRKLLFKYPSHSFSSCSTQKNSIVILW